MTRGLVARGVLVMCALVIVACGRSAAGTSSSAATTGLAGQAASRATGVAIKVPAGDWSNFDYTPQRTATGPTSTGITAGNLGQVTLRKVQIDGIADSSAIELHAVTLHGVRRDLIAVTTTYGKTIALAARTGVKLWEFDPAGVNSAAGNPQVTTASPVADPDRRHLYAASPDGIIHKLSLATGRQVWSRRITFDARHEKIASALNISGKWVVAVTGGYIGDAPPYDGHVVTIDRRSGRIVHVFNSQCSRRHRLIAASSCATTNTQGGSAIWSRAGAVIEPGSRRILVATGNGLFDGSFDWGDSVLELSPDASRLLHNWTPTNQADLASADADVGSTSPALLPRFHGFRLAVQGGKDGRLHLLNLARLDGTGGGAGPRLGGELGEVSVPGGGQMLTAPAVWQAGGHVFVFVGVGSGTAGYELVNATHPSLRMIWSNSAGGTSPVVAGGLLYVYDPSGAILVRQPVSGAALRSLPAPAGHWNSPIVVAGQIIQPTGSYFDRSGTSTIDIYHLPGR